MSDIFVETLQATSEYRKLGGVKDVMLFTSNLVAGLLFSITCLTLPKIIFDYFLKIFFGMIFDVSNKNKYKNIKNFFVSLCKFLGSAKIVKVIKI